MAKLSIMARKPLYGGALASALVLAGCAVEFQNRQAAEELEQRSKPPGSVYAGWRVFQDRCVTCHGAAATGTSIGPDLLPRVGAMGSRRFVSVVLNRYDWSFQTPSSRGDAAALDVLVEEIMQRKEGAVTMPAWQGEPRVNAHILDLYAYLSARAQGTQGPGCPAP